MQNCLVVCATKQDTACEVAGQIANALRLRGVAVDLECSRYVTSLDGYDAVVIGARLCHGRWQRPTKRFRGNTGPSCRPRMWRCSRRDHVPAVNRHTTGRGIVLSGCCGDWDG